MDTHHTKVEKRNRPPVSCEPCRTRKLRCNRALPCDACTKRDKPSQCHYAANAVRGKPSSAMKPRDMKTRLESLENLIASFISPDDVQAPVPPDNNHPTQQPMRSDMQTSTPPDSVHASSEIPRLTEARDGQMSYVETYHWRSILDDIKEVREHLTTISHDNQHDEESPPTGSETLTNNRLDDHSSSYAGSTTVSLDRILASLPPQPICDKLLSWYFRSDFMVLGIVHPGKFQNEYAEFRKSPQTAPPLWVALLFSILSISVSLRQVAGIIESDDSVPPVRVLQQATRQCLDLGHYTTASAFAVEAFILRIMSCFFSPGGGHVVDLWFELGATIQLAYRMGYHRDPDGLSGGGGGISPFDGEMRRRVWINVFQLDCLVSFQLGYPSLIQAQFCDVKPPRNLEYTDLAPTMTVLPPGRPHSEPTHTLYSISKVECMAVFKKIVQCTVSLSPPDDQQVAALDREMRQVYETKIPDVFRPRDVDVSLFDPAYIIMQRCSIEVLYLKSLVVLHRRVTRYDVPETTPNSSRRLGAEAALRMLSRQADMYMACEPGGRLHEERWMILAMPVQDFLMAAMVICLDLSVRLRELSSVEGNGGDGPTTVDRSMADREYQSLLTTRRIWAIRGPPPPHEAHATVALDLMVKKVSGLDAVMSSSTSHANNNNALVAAGDSQHYTEPMSQMIDGPENVDWDMLDHYLQNLDHLAFDNSVDIHPS